MKFYKLTTPHSQDYISEIIKNMSEAETDYVKSLYCKISMVEYTDELGCECMFAILDDFLVSKLEDIYTNYNIKFNVIDMTKKIVLDDEFQIKYKDYNNRSVQKNILNLIKEYKSNWITKDDILDKILEKGMSSLTNFDLEILNS